MKQYLTVLAGALALTLLQPKAATAATYAEPAGGWLYAYDGSTAGPTLDGSWSHANGSDEWDNSAIGAGRPGGVSTITDSDTYLRIQDTGDPRDYGSGDPGSNRKVYFTNTSTGLSASPLDTGVTLYFRTRLATTGPLDDAHPDGGGGIGPWPAGGDGYPIHDGGKGAFTIRQSTGGTISFSLDDALTGLNMNNLNGGSVTGDVDTGEAGTANVLGVGDGTQWHDVWITIRAGGAGTHQASIYLDGSLTPTVFDLTAGSGSDATGSYIAMGQGATPHSGAIDVDFFNVFEGAVAPLLIPEPSSVMLLALGLVGFFRRRR